MLRFNLTGGIWWALWGMLAIGYGEEKRVIVISPHSEEIRFEFGRRFAQWHQEHYGEAATVDWRDLGGSTDALRFIQSEYARRPEGIGLDCFFGGGQDPYLILVERQVCEPYKPPPSILDGIPQSYNGIEIYDPNHCWYGAALSSFGILQSLRIQGIIGLPLVNRWEQLAQPELYGWVGAGDPRNSGTMTTMFETLLQAYGWERGWQILTQLAGNVRKFDRFSSMTAKDVTLGETAYGLAIDFYAFTQIAAAGRDNLTFALSEDFTAIIPDGIAILKGAPNLEVAQRFIDFVLSDAGQKLWLLPCGHPDGPARYSVERMPVRPDLYDRYSKVSNIQFSPFKLQQFFKFDAQLARDRRDIVAALVGALLVDTHSELQEAWRAVIRRGMLQADLVELGRPPLGAGAALELAGGSWKDPAARNMKKIEWQCWAQQKYNRLK